MFGNDRNQLRQYFVDVWHKAQNDVALEPLEKMVADTIQLHPEYQTTLSDPDKALGKEYLPESGESNPFMHMGMHIAIHEQLNANRPAGIRAIYQQLCARHGDAHEAEHQMMECLAEMMWQAQRQGKAPDDSLYLTALKQLVTE
ncbi:hypothetical protein Tel_04645 [Candidatus Tenderia electrophaga]|jgi:hypothetical protein|uniref:DUF1841 domain-containing protein n=1 Tax=Candidatus Tenderia electrophaga TaxID=1748243 RepID=A0A0S2TBK1_9GAMM|nr:hypothetical protein Tel_04645 [Candidatus Tenderia electrophaga]